MANFEVPNDKREFRCNHCDGKILIPRDLPPTTGPCPHCGGTITSPGPESAPPPPPPVAKIPAAPPAPPAVPQPVPPDAGKAPVPSPVPPVPPVSAVPSAPPQVATPPQPPLPQASASPAPEEPSVPEPPPPPPVAGQPAKIPPKRGGGEAAPVEKNRRRRPPVKTPDDGRKPSSGLIPVMLILLLLIIGAGVAVFFVANEMGRNVEPPAGAAQGAGADAREANYIRIGWQKDAREVLAGYIAGTTVPEKLPFVLHPDQLAERMEDFYGGGVIMDSDTPAEAFSVYELSEEDRRRGLFMMIYDQPPQFDMKEFFRPLATLEVQYGIDEADVLLSTLARVGNFAMEPLRVHAFFKRTEDGLKLDWEVFAQTKYRTFQNFVELPEAGQTGVFRVFIVEDVPDKSRLEAGTRTYRLADPANTTDTARINVKVDSEVGRALSVINWRGTKESRPITRTATVELEWSAEREPTTLEIKRFVCWEFLGLGGQETSSTASTK